MEVVAATPNGGESSPFHNHDVREWSRVDSLTGVLERARRETDHWTSNTNNSSHKYGKVVDCRARSCVDGNLQQEAKRQLEVFQSQIPGSRLQVIKTNTVSSSRWTKKSTQDSHELSVQPFDGLQFNTTLLDVNAQKSKITAGRAAGRRPISKQSSIRNESTIPKYDDTSVTSLHRVSRLCQQIHDSAVKHYLKRPTIHERQTSNSSVEISDAESNVKTNEHSRLTRRKSTSSEDLDITQDQLRSPLIEDENTRKSIKDLEDLETLRGWRRTSKVRRSLQLPKENKASSKPPDLPENNGSVRRIREDLEKGRRLNTALRGNHVNLEALDQILQSISNSSISDKKIDEVENLSSDKEDDESLKKQKRNSFVTVESIKEVRNRLRRTSSPTTNIYKDNKEESDDGIVTEDTNNMPLQEDSFPTKVRSYIYGMENTMSKMSVNGTGSLESRSKHLNGSFAIRNEDWYNRRKSYGFEKMQQEDIISSKPKNTDSSTDSGICRSSEIVSPSNLTNDTAKNVSYNSSNSKLNSWLSSDMKDINGTTITVPVSSKLTSLNNSRNIFQITKDINNTNNVGHWRENEDIIKRHSIAVDESEYVTKLPESKLRKTSLAINTNDLYLDNEDNQFFLNRKPKKVEFCKTEVHFTAESGKVNIVETDEKPPPTQNFRRRRRNSGLIIDDFKNNDLPEFKFGDDIFNDEDIGINENSDLENIFAGLVTVTSNSTNILHDIEEDFKESIDSELPKSILKNKPIKPKPYLLGDTESLLYKNFDNGQNAPWDVKLKAVRDETPMWRSSITVKNTLYGKTASNNEERLDLNNDYEGNDMQIPEFQKLLKNLKPVPKAHPDIEEVRNSFNGIRIISPNNDARRSSWSVSDCIKQVEDLQLTEGKGYSTKINFGNGETTVIENNNTKQVTRHPTWPRREETSNDLDRMQVNTNIDLKHSLREQFKTEEKLQSIHESKGNGQLSNSLTRSSTLASKTTNNDNVKFQVKKLSSPGLVGKNVMNKQVFCDTKHEDDLVANGKTFSERNIAKKGSLEKQKHRKLETINTQGIRNKSPHKEVLRQPKKSEMAYFGVPPSPKLIKPDNKKTKLSEKPDLLQFHENKKEVVRIDEKHHIYENVENVKKSTLSRKKREFDSNILEELTKAADQILQAVNDYANEDSRHKLSADEEERRKRHRHPLDTISETKSWKQNKTDQVRTSQQQSKSSTKTKIRQTSSNSSIESVNKDVKRTSTVYKSTSSVDQKIKRKTTNNDNAAVKANTKARRLQRASSREALLQSHGSSSEDLPAVIEVPVRKHRLARKNKSNSLGSNSTESKAILTNSSKKREDKSEHRLTTSCLPEIRHKTAVSTIRSTAEKATRDKSDKFKTTDSKRKVLHKQDPQGTPGPKCDRNKSSSNKDSNRRPPSSNHKKCSRYEASLK